MSNKNWLNLIILLLVIQLGIMGLLYVQCIFRSPQQSFGALPNGNVFKIIALDRPNVSTKALLSWATLASTATFTFDFVNYKSQLAALANYFTKDGYDNFVVSLNASEVLSTIEQKKLVLSAVAIGPAIMLTQGNQGGNYTWRIQVPLLVRYQSANVNENRKQIVTISITQVSTEEASTGIGISQYVAQETGSEITS